VKSSVKIVFLFTFISSIYCQDRALSNLIKELNSEIIKNSESPNLPNLDEVKRYSIFNKDNPNEFYSVNRLLDINSVYATYAKYYLNYETEFTYFHINILEYTSDLLFYYENDESVNLLQMLTGLSTMLRGSIIIFSSEELNIDNRLLMAEKTYEITNIWWPKLPVPMQTRIFTEAIMRKEIEKNESIINILDKIINLYKL
jgi:hypothetical protein